MQTVRITKTYPDAAKIRRGAARLAADLDWPLPRAKAFLWGLIAEHGAPPESATADPASLLPTTCCECGRDIAPGSGYQTEPFIGEVCASCFLEWAEGPRIAGGQGRSGNAVYTAAVLVAMEIVLVAGIIGLLLWRVW